MNKSEVNAGDWEVDLTGGEMRVYVGIDMAKDKFDYCAMDRENNVLCAGSNCSNNRNEFQKFSETVNALRMTGVMLSIGMESTGIYHLPLYNYLSTEGYRVRILNGLEVRGMKKARVRKTSNDTIDAQLIARYLMVNEANDSFAYPKELENLRELITAYDVVNCKIRTTKNNIIRVMEMLFSGLSSIIEINDDTIVMLERCKTPDEFISAGKDIIMQYVTPRKSERILRAAEISPRQMNSREASIIEMSSLIRILRVLNEEKKKIEDSMSVDSAIRDHVIGSIPGIGPVTGSIIIGKIGDINRFESAEKLVAFAGMDPVIKESGKKRSERSISKRGDPLLRSAIYLSTLAAIRSNPVIYKFYHRKTDGGMPRQKALVAASRKQCHIIWSVWHNNRPFEVPEKFKTNTE